MGGVGAGKSTMRKERYSAGYAVLDAGEIYAALINDQYCKFEALKEPIDMLGSRIALKAMRERRNIVTEMTGKTGDEIKTVAEAMRSIGYKLRLEFVSCEPAEAYKRHLKAVEDDLTYISSHFTESMHQKWLLEAVKECIDKKGR